MKKKWFKIGITNFVTFLRSIGVLAIIPAYLIYGGYVTAILAACCLFTDFVDGKMARGLNASTFFGSLFDGVSDKLFLISNMILLMGIMPQAWILILLELGIAGVQILKYKTHLNVKSNYVGKVKMCIVSVAIVLAYLSIDPNLLEYAKNDIMANFFAKVKNIPMEWLFRIIAAADVTALISYVFEFKKGKEEYLKNEEQIKKEQEEKKEELRKDIHERSLNEVLFDPEFYQKYQDSSNLMDITSEVLTRKRVKK